MAELTERSSLRVEGNDDCYALRYLLGRHGVDYDQNPRPSWFPSIDAAGSKEKLLRGVKTAVSVTNGRPIGFVLDANSSLQDRWRAITARLRDVDMETPAQIPPEGFIGECLRFQTRVGVWLMPDNRREGTLEHFLETLVHEADPLLCYARESAVQAKELHGASYSNAHKEKAVLHTWLAWQRKPGLPYGTAIRARFFRHDSPVAKSFVAWFRRVFEPKECSR